MLERIEATIKIFNERIARFPAVLLILLATFITIDCLLRYVVAKPTPGRVELSAELMAYLVYFAVAYALNRGAHVQITFVATRMPPRLRAVDEIFVNLVAVFVFGLITYAAWGTFWRSFIINELIMAPIDIPIWIGKLAVVIGGAIMLFNFLLRLILSSTHLPSKLPRGKE